MRHRELLKSPTRQTKFMEEKQKMTKTTPKKKVVNGDAKEIFSKKTPPEIMLDRPTSQSIPDLRLEAKMTAQENSRLFAGRQIHPFFSSWKTSKRNQEIIDLESTSSFERKDTSPSFKPIHVLDMVEDDAHSLDWGNWSFSDGDFPSASSRLEDESSSVYERSVNSLKFDDFSSACYPSSGSTHQSKISLDPFPIAHNEDGKVDRTDSIQAFSSCMTFNTGWQDKFVQQRSCNQPENCLWTDKFQPRKAAEICGNGEAVKFISEWLYLWHEKGSQTGKSSFHDEKIVGHGIDYFCYQSDTDSENMDEEMSLKNVLLVTGPVGSGKSAAIYACAEEQGFQVLEINASDWRNGALVKQKFGEALESHWLEYKIENTANSEKRPPSKSSPEVIEVTERSENEVVELIPLSDEEDSQLANEMPSKLICSENRVLNVQNKIKTLILFEDVEATLSEDRGFLSTIQQLAQTAKRPMILTANNYNPILPNNLDRLEVSFSAPSLKELLGLGHVVCAAEKAKINPWLMDRFIESCQGDIRKTIMNLQFWCQGQASREVDESQMIYSPLPFDLEAGHATLPKLIPWGYPSRLSEIVEEEITKALETMEERYSLVDIVVEEELNNERPYNCSEIHCEPDHIEIKKEAILSLHCSTLDEDGLLVQPDCSCEFSSSSGSPIAFSGRNVRRKRGAVISSDSEMEHLGDTTPTVSCRGFGDGNNEMTGMSSTSPSHCCATETCCHPNDQLSLLEEDQVKQNCFTCSEKAIYSHVNGVCRSLDVSGVPESSFVPETEINDQTDLLSAVVSCGLVLRKEEVDSLSKNELTNFSSDKNDMCCTPFYENQEMLGNGSDIDRAMFHREEVGDSHIEHVEGDIRGNQMLDECSRIDFAKGAKTLYRLRSHQQVDSIEEIWRRLRKCKTDLCQHVTSEQKNASQALKVASEMSNIISEADLLLSSCQLQICDTLEPSLLTCEESELCSWYDDHLHMSSIMAQHGICFYTKESVGLGSNGASLDSVDLALEMLSSSTNGMALGKLLSVDRKIMENSEMKSQMSCSSSRRKMNSCLCNIVQSVIPSKAHLALRGNAFHEYLSSLSTVSRSEARRLSEHASQRKSRRARTARHYLSSGSFALSPEDISLLSQYNCYRKLNPI
ncbi:hypothetical protein ACH5RR_033998 [Cinchona calisaya]|uniref:ATPase AAA-type core domain-containing protein n=1 Tax=Cinchona calisaya TaxID=153742 RepID=A0ABD2YCL0_9GENT